MERLGGTLRSIGSLPYYAHRIDAFIPNGDAYLQGLNYLLACRICSTI